MAAGTLQATTPIAAPVPAARPLTVPPVTENVRGPVMAGAAIVGGFVAILVLMAVFLPLDNAVGSTGFVHMEANRQSVQHKDGGTVKELLVKEGEYVREGQTLIRLNDTDLRAQVAVYRGQLDALRAIQGRLLAERDRRPNVTFDPSLAARRSDPNVAALIASQEQLFAARKSALESQVGVLEQRVAQLRQQIVGYKAQYAASDTQLGLIKEELKGAKQLNEKGWAPKTRVLALERNVAFLGGNRDEQQANTLRAEQGIGEARMQIQQAQRDRMTEVADQLRDVEIKLFDVEPRLASAVDQLSRTELKAPMSGYVVGLNAFTVGAAITPGQRVMDIVPETSRILIDGQIPPENVSDVRVGQEAKIQLSTVTHRLLPFITGTVSRVSADRLVDEKSGRAFYTFSVQVDPDEVYRKTGIRLVSGMPVDVAMRTRQRTAWDHLAYPLARVFNRAFREE